MPHFLVTVSPRSHLSGGEFVQSLYLLAGAALAPAEVAQLAAELLHDPVVQSADWVALGPDTLAADALPSGYAAAIELAYRPGVTDNEGETILEGARRIGITTLEQARALRRYCLPAGVDPATRADALAIDLVQVTLNYHGDAAARRLALYTALLTPPVAVLPQISAVALRTADDNELLRISQQGILALDLDEMRALRDYFVARGRDPLDGELETIAQTWSEHCSHKSFKARVIYKVQGTGDRGQPNGVSVQAEQYPALHMLGQDVEINSLIKTFLMVATQKVLEQKAAAPAPPAGSHFEVLSAFVDNAGIIAFDDDHEVSFKVETHNHPSALEPFGGANTGVGGVIRDVLGVSARPIANTDILCFGMPNTPPEALQAGVLPPSRIALGVVAGVRDYGNKLGIPTVNGAVLFDHGYTANPLVYCGTLGLAPRGSHPRNVAPGDYVVVLGGRTGRDGIHGATFSSIELTHDTATTVGSAVQIGDPITEKKVLDVVLQARDRQLYSAITDCGAGGLSSAVGEMGAEIGVAVELADVPLKYAGLQPWEVWISEAQERMVLAVPPQHLDAFLALCASEDVEATAIGRFSDDKHLRVQYQGATLVDLDMHFLHDGRPQRVLEALWAEPDRVTGWQGDRVTGETSDAVTFTGDRDAQSVSESENHPVTPAPGHPVTESASQGDTPSLAQLVTALLAHPNIASKEPIIRTYDHEVGGATVIKPLVGAQMDGPGDAAVLKPVPSSNAGLALGNGINPRYGRIDPYWMALAAVDEALRNVVAVGGDPSRTAILDNFCWGDPRRPDRMAGLVRACAGCYDAALAFGTPFISGKDSLNNEYRTADGERVAIPPTLLISALAYVPDITRCVTMDLKSAGNRLYLVGTTRDELRGSHLEALGVAVAGSALPQVDLAQAPATFAALHGAIASGLVRACHDLSEGGLAVAAAEMAIGGDLGLDLDLGVLGSNLTTQVRLFSETPSRFLVEVAPEQADAFVAALAGTPLALLGQVTAAPEVLIRDGDMALLRLAVDHLRQAWQSGLAPLAL